MKNVKFLKLVNDERQLTRIASAKSCTVGATDFCVSIDNAHCWGWAKDLCVIDETACSFWSDDICDTDIT